jgi:hypothetical protein
MFRELTLILALGLSGQPEPMTVVNPLDYAPCGLNCLYAVNSIRKSRHDYDSVRTALGAADGNGTHSMADIVRAAEAIGLCAVPLKLTWAELREMPMPVILVIRRPDKDANHFIVCKEVGDDHAVTFDPPTSPRSVPQDALRLLWTGNAIVFPHDPAEGAAVVSRLRWHRVAGLAKPLAIGVGALVAIVLAVRALGFRASSLARSGRDLMRAKVLVPVASILLLAGAAFGWPVVFRPKCECDGRIDFGEMEPGQHQATVSIRNSGRAALEVKSIKSTCTCAVTDPPSSIAPGCAADVPVKLKVGRGPEAAYLIVESNDPDGSKAIALGWFGQAPLETRPRSVFSTGEPSHRDCVRELVIQFPEGAGAKVPSLAAAKCPSGRVKVEAVGCRPSSIPASYGFAAIRKTGEYVVRFVVSPPAGPSNFEDKVELSLQVGESIHRIEVPVKVRFSGASFVPLADGVVFAADSPAGLVGQERTIDVRSWNGAPKLESVPAWLRCRVEPVGDIDFRISLAVDGTPPGELPRTETVTLSPLTPTDRPLDIKVHLYLPPMKPGAPDKTP